METTKEVSKKIESSGFIKILKTEAQSNPLFMLVMKKFASRIRNRSVLTPAALKLSLSKDDLNYPKGRYAEILRVMSSHGLGRLELGPRGQIRALKGIPIDLKELGQAVLADTVVEPKITPPVIQDQTKITPAQSYSVQLAVGIKGGEIRITGVEKLSPDSLTDFIDKFAVLCRRYSK